LPGCGRFLAGSPQKRIEFVGKIRGRASNAADDFKNEFVITYVDTSDRADQHCELRAVQNAAVGAQTRMRNEKSMFDNASPVKRYSRVALQRSAKRYALRPTHVEVARHAPTSPRCH